MPEFIVTDPTGKEHIVTAPDGATQDQALEFAKSQFASTPGGAAVGNPNIIRQGDKSVRPMPDTLLQTGAKVGGAGLIGGVAGAFAPEILTGLGGAAAMIPGGQPLAPFLFGAGNVLRGARVGSALAGATAGLASESAGQIADMTEAGKSNPLVGEATRLIAGGPTGEIANLAVVALEKYIKTPALSILSKIKKETAISILDKLNKNPGSLSDQERRFVDEQIAALRGGPKNDAPLEATGNALETGLNREAGAASIAEQQARIKADQLGKVVPLPQRDLADIGGDLGGAISKRYETALAARSAQYKATEQARDALVSQQEAAGNYISKTPEYQGIINNLKMQLDNSEAMQRSPDVQRAIQKVISELTNSEKTPAQRKLVQNGQVLEWQTVDGVPKPVSFQAIDDVRRKLGEVFKGKPAEGYEALNDARGKMLYAQLTELQKKYAGGESGPHAKLLSDYHNSSDELAQFRSKMGKKATALDQYDESQFANDPSTLPGTYFKTRASVQALKELTGDQTLVNKSAMQYVNRELSGSSAADVRKWAGKNSEWLSEVPTVQRAVDAYAGRLEVSERAARQAANFADELSKRTATASKTAESLTSRYFPKERIVNLVQNGDADMWAKAGPAIASVPEGKANVLAAVRQAIADNPIAPDDFARRIRPALEQSRLADNASLDMIQQRLQAIAEKNIPEPEKLGLRRRLLLNTLAGYSASAISRGSVEAAKMIPD